jgi:hypothetical protein
MTSLREIYIMRKVLLATTAIVALGVTAANADISISGGLDFQYTTVDTASTADSASFDGNIKIVGSVVTDTGLTVTVTQNNSLQGAGVTGTGTSTVRNAQVEDAFMTVAGDFGTIILGATDMVNDRNDGVLGKNNDVFTLAAAGVVGGASKLGTDTDDSTAANIGFESPSVNGLKIYGGAVPDGLSQMGANFSLSGVNLMVQTTSGSATAGRDEVAMGAGVTLAGLSINVGKKTEDVSGTKTNSSDINFKYAVNDAMTVSLLIEEGKTAAVKHENQGFEVKYVIAPGLTAYVGTNSTDNGAALGTATGTAAALSVSF